MRIAALVPARKGSVGIKDKNFKEFYANQSLVDIACECARDARLSVFVSTDWKDYARPYGVGLIQRPEHAASNGASMLEVVKHFLSTFENGMMPEVVVLLQPTSPLRTPADLLQAIGVLASAPEVDSVVSVSEVPKKYAPEHGVRIQSGFLYGVDGVSLDAAVARQNAATAYFRDGTVYAMRSSVVLAGSLYGGKCVPLRIEPWRAMSIDDDQDWDAAQRLMTMANSGL